MEPDADYGPDHVSEALAADPRVGELGLAVAFDGRRVTVSGVVSTPERRDAVPAVVGDAVPGAVVDNRVTVADLTEPVGEEPESIP